MERGGGFGYPIALVLLAAYLVVAATYVFLPLRFDAEYRELMKRADVWANINLIPLRLGSDYAGDPGASQAVGNLLLGVPLGFGLPFVARLRARAVLLAGALFGVAIEAIQLVLNLLGIAFPARTIDVNDAILNGTGAAIGLGLFLACRELYSKIWSARRPGGPWRHFHEVLTGRWLAHTGGHGSDRPGPGAG